MTADNACLYITESVNYRTAAARIESVPLQCFFIRKWADLRM